MRRSGSAPRSDLRRVRAGPRERLRTVPADDNVGCTRQANRAACQWSFLQHLARSAESSYARTQSIFHEILGLTQQIDPLLVLGSPAGVISTLREKAKGTDLSFGVGFLDLESAAFDRDHVEDFYIYRRKRGPTLGGKCKLNATKSPTYTAAKIPSTRWPRFNPSLDIASCHVRTP